MLVIAFVYRPTELYIILSLYKHSAKHLITNLVIDFICESVFGFSKSVIGMPQGGKLGPLLFLWTEYSDIVILADEDPRGEKPLELLEMIAKGCANLEREKELFLIPDRPQAIRKAFALAQSDDMVLLLGKGHENSIIYKDYTMPYDEISEAKKALSEIGYN